MPRYEVKAWLVFDAKSPEHAWLMASTACEEWTESVKDNWPADKGTPPEFLVEDRDAVYERDF